MAPFPRQPLSATDEIKIARALLRRAVSLPAGHVSAMNGDIEDAFSLLGGAATAVRIGNAADAADALAEALELLTSPEALRVAEDGHGLRLAVEHANSARRHLAQEARATARRSS